MSSTIYTDERSSRSTQRALLMTNKDRLEVLEIDGLEAGRQLNKISEDGMIWNDIEDCRNRKMLLFTSIVGTTIFVISIGINFFN